MRTSARKLASTLLGKALDGALMIFACAWGSKANKDRGGGVNCNLYLRTLSAKMWYADIDDLGARSNEAM